MNFINDRLISEYSEKEDLDLTELARKSQINRGTIYNMLLGKKLRILRKQLPTINAPPNKKEVLVVL